MENIYAYQLDLPYPTITVEKNDQRYGRMLSDLYAGRDSESTSIAQYRFHTLYLKEIPDVLAAYKGILAVEIIHQELLAHLILDLCFSPKLLSGMTNHFWNAGYLTYRQQLLSILQADAQTKGKLLAHYRRIIECVENESIRALLNRIIMDEELHLQTLVSLIAQYK